MISLDGLKACSRAECRVLLPADLDDETSAGFWVAERVAGRGSRPKRYHSWCKDCTRRSRRERYQERPRRPGMTHDEELQRRRDRHAERMATDPVYVVGRRALARATAARRSADPVERRKLNAASERYRRTHRVQINEAKRLAYALRAEQEGRPLRRRRRRRDQPRIPAEPFRRWLVAFRETSGLYEHAAVARALGMSDRRVASVLGREYRRVSFDVVDRALTLANWSVYVRGRLVVTADDLYSNLADLILTESNRTRREP